MLYDFIRDNEGTLFVDVDFIGKHDGGIDEIVDFIAVTVNFNGVTDDFNVSDTEWAIFAEMGFEIGAGHARTNVGVLEIAADDTDIMQEAGGVC